MLVAQVLSTNAFYRAVMQERGLEPAGSTETGRNNADTFSGLNYKESDKKSTLDMLEKMVTAIQKEIDDLKNN